MARTIPLLMSNRVDLTALREGPGLRVSWNNSSRAFNDASGARLVVKRTGSPDQEFSLAWMICGSVRSKSRIQLLEWM